MSAYIYVRTQFEAQHRWKDAPEDVKFLRSYHRHIFHVKVTIAVAHGNRDVEFFQFKRQLDSYLNAYWALRSFDNSCEDIAEAILTTFKVFSVAVEEDGENGALVMRSTGAEAYKTRCFVGTEIEGPQRGSSMFFVPGSTTGDDFLAAVQRARKADPHLGRIYYGAGNDRTVIRATLYAILGYAKAEGMNVDVEVGSWADAQTILVESERGAFKGEGGWTAGEWRDTLAWVIVLDAIATMPLDGFKSLTKLMHKEIVGDVITWRHLATTRHWDTWLFHPTFDQDRYV